MRRVLSVMLAVGILLGATACGDDKKDDKATEQTDDTKAADPGSNSGGSKADEYCAAVDAFVKPRGDARARRADAPSGPGLLRSTPSSRRPRAT